ncbi:unnamed protein product [Paramecium sonneborni]|uniref:Uncharacterized protein n=1 Tax=Paramecium sonneborni TaxID=65129 RepID=A0A8S1QTZ3_9CILI|nr:unnamed protein product [Paramecium sonneborni]
MEILSILKYSDTYYKEILEEFGKFKQYILNFLKNFEDFLLENIAFHIDITTISKEYSQFIEKEFNIFKFVNSIQNKYTIQKNDIQYSGIKKDLSQTKKELQNIYSTIQMFFETQLKSQELFSWKNVILEDENHHINIEKINKNEFRRSNLSNGRWLIQCIKILEYKNKYFTSNKVTFTINGSDIIFGIASLSQIKKHNFELQCDIPSAYFIRQDGVHFGFGLTEVQQDFDVPEFSSKKGQKVSMQLKNGQIILQNLITKAKEEYEIPKLYDDWCYIFGLRFQNDSIILEE